MSAFLAKLFADFLAIITGKIIKASEPTAEEGAGVGKLEKRLADKIKGEWDK